MTWLSPERRHVPDDGRLSIQLNTKVGAASTPVDEFIVVSERLSDACERRQRRRYTCVSTQEADRAGQRRASKAQATSPGCGIRRVVAESPEGFADSARDHDGAYTVRRKVRHGRR